LFFLLCSSTKARNNIRLFIDVDHRVDTLHRPYGSERLDAACKRALQTDACSYMRIKNMLQNNLDSVPLSDQVTESCKTHIPAHGNIRGASAYKEINHLKKEK